VDSSDSIVARPRHQTFKQKRDGDIDGDGGERQPISFLLHRSMYCRMSRRSGRDRETCRDQIDTDIEELGVSPFPPLPYDFISQSGKKAADANRGGGRG
jgi:hypothetical protein